MLKTLKKEFLIYLAILICLSLFMHPERITMIESPLQLGHSLLWSFGAYVVVAIARVGIYLILKVLNYHV